MKNGLAALMITIALLSIAGCQKTASKTGMLESKPTQQQTTNQNDSKQVNSNPEEEKQNSAANGGPEEKNKLDAEKIVVSNFGKDDKNYDFKLKITTNFISTYNKILINLDSRYADPVSPEGFKKAGLQSQLEYSQEIKDYDQQYKYIKKIQYALYFNDGKTDQLTFNDLYLTLCDEDKDGKIELNDKSNNILKTVYPKINLAEVQKKIDASMEAQKKDDNSLINIETEDKYCKISSQWYKCENNPVEITIEIEQYQDYPNTLIDSGKAEIRKTN